jgi:hypothetical protein
VSLTASLYAVPILAGLAGGAAFVDRRTALWLAAAAAASAVPLAVLSWLDRR